VGDVFDHPLLALTGLWCRAIDVHEQRPLTRSAALAALAVNHEDQRRRGLGIPSIFERPEPGPAGRGSP